MKKYLICLFALCTLNQGFSQCVEDDIYAVEDDNAVCIEVVDNARIIYSNNYPDHTDDYNQPQFTLTAGDYEYGVCAFPEEASSFTPLYEETETTAGCTYTYTFGVSINGVKYDPNSAETFVNDDGSNNLDWHVEASSTANNIGKNMGQLNGGHLNPFGEYHYHVVPTDYFVNDLGIDGTEHSPIVGYAADGFPIYYRYVYSDADDENSSIATATSGYSLKSGTRPGDGLTAPDGDYDGNYYEDYEYDETSTILDECNGRNGVTPDFPYGTYYYVITEEYPYIPRCFKGTVLDNTFRIGPSASCGSSTAANDCAVEVQGCPDPFAVNYNPDANSDDGSCSYCTGPATPTVSDDVSYCDGETVTDLTVSGTGGTYTWYDDAELSNVVGTGSTYSPSTAVGSTTYYVTETSSCESDAASVTVTINALPTVSITASSTTVCSGDEVTLSGQGASSYSWDNGVTDGVAFTPSATTTYTVTGTDSNGCDNTAEVTITVTDTPATPAAAGGATYCEGETITDLTVTGTGGTYTWYDDENLTNEVGTGSTLTPSSTVGTTTYYVTETNGACESTASSTTVTINETPTVAITASATSICTGEEVTLTGSGASSYSWDNGVTDGVAFAPTATATYTVTGTGSNGCTITAEVTITVTDTPATPTAAGGATYCEGETITDLTVTGTGGTYTWYDDENLTNEVGTGSTLTPSTTAGTTTYYVTETNGSCESTASSTTVTINETPTVAITASATSICTGEEVTLTGTGASSYSWDNGVTDGVAFAPTATTTYTVTGTGSNGCTNTAEVTITVTDTPATPTAAGGATYCEGETITDLTVTGTGGTYTWYDDENLTNEVGTGSTLTPSSTVGTTTYYVTETNGSCESTASSTTVTINETPTVAITASATSICVGEEVTLTGSGASSYSWDNGVTDAVAFAPTATTTYTVTGTGSNGCDNTAEVTITVNEVPEKPSITVSGTTLTSSSAEGNQWFMEGTAISGATAQTYEVDENGAYSVQVTINDCVSEVSDAVNVESVLGIDGLTGVSVWPNPVADRLHISVEGADASYKIFQMNGQVVMSGPVTEQVDVHSLQRGYYIIIVQQKDKQVIERFLKN